MPSIISEVIHYWKSSEAQISVAICKVNHNAIDDPSLALSQKKDNVFLIAFLLSKLTRSDTCWRWKACSKFTPLIDGSLPWTLHLPSWLNLPDGSKKWFSYLIVLSFTHMNQTCPNSYPLTSNEQSWHRNTDSPAYGLTVMSYSLLDPPTSLCLLVCLGLFFTIHSPHNL